MEKLISIEDAQYFYRAHGVMVRLAGNNFVRLSKGKETIIKSVSDNKFPLSVNDPAWLPLPAFLFAKD